MKSKIDSTKELKNNTTGVVSLVKSGRHAILIIETLVNKNYAMRKLHFIPKNKSTNGNNNYDAAGYYGRIGFWGIIINACEPGKIEDYDVGITKNTNNEIVKKILYDKNNTEINALKLDKDHYRSWCCEYKKINTMRKKVAKEIDNPPLFQIRGNFSNAVKENKKTKGHSCMSWVAEKLYCDLSLFSTDDYNTLYSTLFAFDTDKYIPNVNM